MLIKPYFCSNNYKNLSWWLVLLTIIVSVVIRFHLLETPFERDEGSYAYLGQQILDGKIPYVDFFERKFPVIFYAYAALIAIFGYSLTELHLAFTVVNVLTIMVVFLLVKKLFNPLTGWISATSFALYSLSPFASGFTAQSEHLVIFFVVLGFLTLVHALNKQHLWLYVVAGIIMSTGLLIKQNGIIFIFFSVIALITILLVRQYRYKQILKYLTFYAIGGIIPVILVAVILFFQGAFEEMIYWTIHSSADYVSSRGLDKVFANIAYMVQRISQTHLIMWILSLMGLILFWVLRNPLHFKILLTLFVVFSFVAVAPGFRFFGHYWLFIYPAMALLVGMFFYALSHLFKKGILILLIGLSVVFIFNIFQNRSYYFGDDVNQPVKKTYGSDLFPATKKIADYLNEQMDADDQLLVLGLEPQIYVYTNKQAPVRFHFMRLLTKIKNDSLYTAYKDTMVKKLLVNPPDYIVYMANFMDDDSAKDFKSELEQLLANYEQTALVDLRKWKTTKYFIDKNWGNYKPGNNHIAVLKKK